MRRGEWGGMEVRGRKLRAERGRPFTAAQCAAANETAEPAIGAMRMVEHSIAVKNHKERSAMSLSPILLLHVASGSVGLASGTMAICVRKGSRTHASAGTVFSVAMLTLAASGVYMAVEKSQPSNVLGGLMTFYMVGTAWMAGRRNPLSRNWSDWGVAAAALAVGVSCVSYGVTAVLAAGNLKDQDAPAMILFGAVVLLAAVGDVRLLMGGEISGTRRIARHLWRMCFGLFIASGSFFLGRARIFPQFVQKSGVLVVLTVLPLGLLVFWLFRVRFAKAWKAKFASQNAVAPALAK